MLISAFLSRIDDYRARTGRQEGGVSDVLFGRGAKIRELREGKTLTVSALEEAHRRLDGLFAELDAHDAVRAEAAGQGAVVHPGKMAESGPDCDRNGAGQLRRVEGAA